MEEKKETEKIEIKPEIKEKKENKVEIQERSVIANSDQSYNMSHII